MQVKYIFGLICNRATALNGAHTVVDEGRIDNEARIDNK
jgi:hypothetical protein